MSEVPQAAVDAADTVDLGKLAYDAYLHHVGYKSVRGEPLPEFADQEPRLQNAWRVAAQAVAIQVNAQAAAAERERILSLAARRYGSDDKLRNVFGVIGALATDCPHTPPCPACVFWPTGTVENP
jgi:hypothetical protein